MIKYEGDHKAWGYLNKAKYEHKNLRLRISKFKFILGHTSDIIRKCKLSDNF